MLILNLIPFFQRDLEESIADHETRLAASEKNVQVILHTGSWFK